NAQKRETAQLVQKAIMELPADIRSAVLLRDIEQLSYEEVAKILNVPVGTAKSRVHRGRQLLKERLEQILGREFVAE
ncbi:MAG: RNA polymerase subunit sigma-24, partial [Planctomycetota bacterium]